MITVLDKILVKDVKALLVGNTLQIPGDRLKSMKAKVYAAEKRSKFEKRFQVYRVAIGKDRVEYAIRIHRVA